MGAPAAGRLPRRAVRPARRRPVRAPRSVPDRGGPEGRARAPARHHRAAGRLGEHPRRGAARRRRTRRSCKSTRRQPAADPRPVRRRRLDPARGPAPRPGGARLRPQPGRRAHQQGADRDPAEVRRARRRSSRASPSRGCPGRARPAWPRTCAATASGCATRPRSGSATSTRRPSSPTAPRRRSSPGSGRAPSPAPTPPARARCRSSARSGSARRKARNATSCPIPDGKRVRFEIRGPDGVPARRNGRPQRRDLPALRHAGAAGLHPRRRQGRPDGRPAHGDRRRRQRGSATTCRPTTSTRRPPTFARPDDVPEARLATIQALGFRVQSYGMRTWADLFTNRQLTALTTFSDLVREARSRTCCSTTAPSRPTPTPWHCIWRFAVSRIVGDYSTLSCTWQLSSQARKASTTPSRDRRSQWSGTSPKLNPFSPGPLATYGIVSNG